VKYRTNDADTLDVDYDPTPVADLAELFAPIHAHTERATLQGRKLA
jgi:hypothetical protein